MLSNIDPRTQCLTALQAMVANNGDVVTANLRYWSVEAEYGPYQTMQRLNGEFIIRAITGESHSVSFWFEQKLLADSLGCKVLMSATAHDGTDDIELNSKSKVNAYFTPEAPFAEVFARAMCAILSEITTE